MVFRRPAAETLFCEYEAPFAADFWPALRDLARYHGDATIELLVLDPDVDSYYVPEYHFYPAASLSIDLDEDYYWDVLNEEPEGDVSGAIVHSANTIALTGSSGAWGLWGERSLGVALVQGVPAGNRSDGWRAEYGPFLEVEEALQHYIEPNFRGRGVPVEVVGSLERNYPIYER